jgi:hypothetical protein
MWAKFGLIARDNRLREYPRCWALEDLLTGYEVPDYVIDLLYSGRAARVAALAGEVLTRLSG